MRPDDVIISNGLQCIELACDADKRHLMELIVGLYSMAALGLWQSAINAETTLGLTVADAEEIDSWRGSES